MIYYFLCGTVLVAIYLIRSRHERQELELLDFLAVDRCVPEAAVRPTDLLESFHRTLGQFHSFLHRKFFIKELHTSLTGYNYYAQFQIFLENILPFYIASFFTKKKLISFIKFIVKFEWKKCWIKEIKYRYTIIYGVCENFYGSATLLLPGVYKIATSDSGAAAGADWSGLVAYRAVGVWGGPPIIIGRANSAAAHPRHTRICLAAHIGAESGTKGGLQTWSKIKLKVTAWWVAKDSKSCI